MPIIEKITQEDLILYEIFKNPALFGEFVLNIDSQIGDEEFILTNYQREFMLDFSEYVSFCCARAVGKTVAISLLILWALIFNIFPNDYIIYTVPNKVHLEPVFTTLSRLLRSNSILKLFIDPKGGINNSDFSLKLLNNTKLMCRIAGQSGTGANVIGLHSPYVLLDEAGYYPVATFNELQPVINTWERGYKLLVSGVPTGVRENNVLYHCDRENNNYTKHRVSAFQNPRFAEKDRLRAIDQYGAEDADEYIHSVLGQHGKPIFSLFDRSTFQIQPYPIYKIVIDGIRESENIMDMMAKIAMIPPIKDERTDRIFGIDLGYTEPTAIFIMTLDDIGRLKFHAKIQLSKVSYPLQERIIDLLDSRFNPSIIGMDKGSAGIAVIQDLLELKEYVHKDYKKKIVPIDFSASMILGLNTEGEEIKSKTKPFTVSVLQDYTNNGRIVYTSTDMEMIVELERMTYTKTVNGEIAYRTLATKGGKKGDDHFTSALLCAATSYYLMNEFSFSRREKKKLFKPSWV
jgi:hypothetical protein